jgi:hypothetical protein
MKRFALAGFCSLTLFAAGCGDDDPDPQTNADATITAPDGGQGDTGSNTHPDATTDEDGGGDPPDQGMNGNGDAMPDGGADGGMVGPLIEEMEPGQFVQVAEGRINIGDGIGISGIVDTYGSVKTRFGMGTRSSGMDARSYEWDLSNNVHLVVWFGNTNGDGDDSAPNNVDDTDEVLWISVSGGYMGKTTRLIGIGSTQMDVEMQQPNGYGRPQNPVDLTNPPGVLASYFTHGILVAYDANMRVRTVTICRAYGSEPSADIDPGEGSLDFNALGQIRGFKDLVTGTGQNQIRNILGDPDGAGPGPGGTTVWNYTFIGIEIFFFGAQTNALFMTLHPPYYGAFNNTTAGPGSTRADIEAALGMGPGETSVSNPQFVCYPDSMDAEIAVAYTMDATPLAALIMLPLSPPLVGCP